MTKFGQCVHEVGEWTTVIKVFSSYLDNYDNGS